MLYLTGSATIESNKRKRHDKIRVFLDNIFLNNLKVFGTLFI